MRILSVSIQLNVNISPVSIVAIDSRVWGWSVSHVDRISRWLKNVSFILFMEKVSCAQQSNIILSPCIS